MEGRVRVLTASGINTLFKVWFIKIQPWLRKPHRDEQHETSPQGPRGTSGRAVRRAALSGAHKLAVCRIQSLSHHTTVPQMEQTQRHNNDTGEFGCKYRMSATGEDPVSRPYQWSKIGPWWVTFRVDRAPGRQAFYLLLGSAGLNLQPILFSFLSSVSVSLRLVLPHWLGIYKHVLSLVRCWYDQGCSAWILWERGSSCETVSVNLEITRISEADLTFSPPSHPKVCLPDLTTPFPFLVL